MFKLQVVGIVDFNQYFVGCFCTDGVAGAQGLFSFGDSYTDTGYTDIASPPYGITWPANGTARRFSDGRNQVDYLGMTITLSLYPTFSCPKVLISLQYSIVPNLTDDKILMTMRGTNNETSVSNNSKQLLVPSEQLSFCIVMKYSTFNFFLILSISLSIMSKTK